MKISIRRPPARPLSKHPLNRGLVFWVHAALSPMGLVVRDLCGRFVCTIGAGGFFAPGSGRISMGGVFLDGVNDIISIQDHPALAVNSMSLVILQKVTAWNALGTLASKQANNPPAYPVFDFRYNSGLEITVGTGGGVGYSALCPPVTAGEVQLMGFSYGGGYLQGFTNGNGGTPTTGSGALGTSVTSIVFGDNPTFQGRPVGGTFYEARMWDRPLSAAEHWAVWRDIQSGYRGTLRRVSAPVA